MKQELRTEVEQVTQKIVDFARQELLDFGKRNEERGVSKQDLSEGLLRINCSIASWALNPLTIHPELIYAVIEATAKTQETFINQAVMKKMTANMQNHPKPEGSSDPSNN